jgi:hypothetical protein
MKYRDNSFSGYTPDIYVNRETSATLPSEIINVTVSKYSVVINIS